MSQGWWAIGACLGRSRMRGFAEFVRLLDDKADWYGSRAWKADRWFASSKTCSSCGQVNAELRLADRSWVCPGCGVVHDRDRNAAGNLLSAMRADIAR